MGILSKTFSDAVAYAVEAHSEQTRKSTATPYAAHLLGVASMILESGGDETAAIVGLLHDVVEDQDPDGTRLDDVRARFGDVVADAVAECSLEDKRDGADWRMRKLRYIGHMRSASPLALQVSLADKVYNLRSTVDDYRRLGDGVFERFNAPDPESVSWYYQELAEVYHERRGELPPSLLDEMTRQLANLRTMMKRPDCVACGAGDVVPVVIGMPIADDMDREEAGDFVLAGCVVHEDTPDWSCRQCGHQWRDLSVQRW